MRDPLFYIFWRKFLLIILVSISVSCYAGITMESWLVGIVTYLISSGLLIVLLMRNLMKHD